MVNRDLLADTSHRRKMHTFQINPDVDNSDELVCRTDTNETIGRTSRTRIAVIEESDRRGNVSKECGRSGN
jgi:hypothetical protein